MKKSKKKPWVVAWVVGGKKDCDHKFIKSFQDAWCKFCNARKVGGGNGK